MALTTTEIADLIKSTTSDLGRLKFQQIAQSLQNYEVMSRLMVKDKVKFQSGTAIQKNLMIQQSNAARSIGLYERINVNVADVMRTISIPWRHANTYYAYERRELAMNRASANRVFDIIKTRRADGLLSIIELMEDEFWSKPSSSSDELEPFGVPYWVVKNASTGFNGGNPSGFTSGAGGLDHANWKNYTYQYTNVSKDDLIDGMRTAHRKIRFKSPIDVNDYRKGTGNNYRIYSSESVIKSMERIGEQQNENLGRDLASMDETLTFKKHPIIWVPKLDSDTQNPVYMLDMSTFYPVFLSGEYLREEGPVTPSDQPSVFIIYIDLTWNILCVDRRRQAVLATA